MRSASDSQSFGDLSRALAALAGERRGRTLSAVISDAIADAWKDTTGHRPQRESVMPWVHLAMVGVALFPLLSVRQ